MIRYCTYGTTLNIGLAPYIVHRPYSLKYIVHRVCILQFCTTLSDGKVHTVQFMILCTEGTIQFQPCFKEWEILTTMYRNFNIVKIFLSKYTKGISQCILYTIL